MGRKGLEKEAKRTNTGWNDDTKKGLRIDKKITDKEKKKRNGK